MPTQHTIHCMHCLLTILSLLQARPAASRCSANASCCTEQTSHLLQPTSTPHRRLLLLLLQSLHANLVVTIP
jgi:hypothetical protein